MKDKIMNTLLVVAGKLQQQKHMSAVKNAFSTLLPIIIAGAFCTLAINVVCSTTTTGLSIAKIPGMAWLSNLSPMFETANYATMNFFTIALVVLISIELGNSNGRKGDYVLPITIVAAYVSLCITTVTATAESGEVLTIANVLPNKFTNAQGLFLAMITSLVMTEVYCWIVNSGKLEVKMPDSVPPNVAKPFNVMFPSIITILITSAFGMVFEMVFNMPLFDAVAKVIQAPLQGILTGLPGYVILFMCTTILWVFGIHGTQVLKPIYEPILLATLAENMENVLAGQPAEHILNNSFVSVFNIGTGAGMTGGLIAAIFLFSKREDYRAIAKLSLVPALFNINETMTFGLPIVLNPIFALPFILAPATSAIIGYFMTKIGFATVMAYAVPWTTPPLIKSFLATGGHLGTVATEALCIFVAFLIYIPFVIAANKQSAQPEVVTDTASE